MTNLLSPDQQAPPDHNIDATPASSVEHDITDAQTAEVLTNEEIDDRFQAFLITLSSPQQEVAVDAVVLSQSLRREPSPHAAMLRIMEGVRQHPSLFTSQHDEAA